MVIITTNEGEIHLEIYVNSLDKIVEVWLSNVAKDDEFTRMALEPVYAAYSTAKFKVAVFESGHANLTENTANLLIHNRLS